MIRRNEYVTIICELSRDHVFHNLFNPSNRRVYAMLSWYGNYITQIRTNEKQQVSYELTSDEWRGSEHDQQWVTNDAYTFFYLLSLLCKTNPFGSTVLPWLTIRLLFHRSLSQFLYLITSKST